MPNCRLQENVFIIALENQVFFYKFARYQNNKYRCCQCRELNMTDDEIGAYLRHVSYPIVGTDNI